MIEKIINELNSYDNILILGFGREGKSTYNLIRKYLKNKRLTIADGNDKLLDNNKELLKDKHLSFILGDKYLNNLNDFDLIIKSPGVNFKYVNHDKIRNKITSQIDLFLRFSCVKTIGVTGTKGKSTTASLIYYVLEKLGKKAILAGNIGIPIFNEIEKIDEDTIVVIELSCHQLQFVNASPNISVLLNLYEEHLDLYKSYEEYQLAKLNIFKYQKKDDYAIIGIDSPDSKKWFEPKANTYAFSLDKNAEIKQGIIMKEDGLYLKKRKENILVYNKMRKRNLLGEHNLNNVAATLCVCDILNLPLDKVAFFIDGFKPLEHRMEFVGKYKGINFYNDSIATIPSATINCIKSIPNVQTVIIGGMNRGIDLSSLVDFLNDKNNSVENCLFLKDTGYLIADELIKLGCKKNIIKVNDMKEAVKKAYELTEVNFACVLSPAAASYNTYKNFEERGKDYKWWVNTIGKAEL